jgi:hypothetical protein
MKHIFILSVMLLGCTAQVVDLPTGQINSTSTGEQYATDPSDHIKTNPCPPPYNVVVMRNGNPTTELYYSPCHIASAGAKNPISDPTSWGGNEEGNEPTDGIVIPKPGDPAPF